MGMPRALGPFMHPLIPPNRGHENAPRLCLRGEIADGDTPTYK